MPYRPPYALQRTPWRRHPATIAAVVVGLHIGALWALQAGLLRRAVESVVPAEILVELWSPQPDTTARAAPTPKPPAPKPATPANPAAAQPTPLPVPVVPAAPPAATSMVQPATNSIAIEVGSARASSQNGGESRTTAATAAVVASPKIEQPSSDADYLNNPKPPYPALSKRLSEQGKVVVRALIGTDGRAQEVQLAQSSGFERLDQAALNAARQWRYVPGKRDGVAQAMWFNIPFTFQLQ